MVLDTNISKIYRQHINALGLFIPVLTQILSKVTTAYPTDCLKTLLLGICLDISTSNMSRAHRSPMLDTHRQCNNLFLVELCPVPTHSLPRQVAWAACFWYEVRCRRWGLWVTAGSAQWPGKRRSSTKPDLRSESLRTRCLSGWPAHIAPKGQL